MLTSYFITHNVLTPKECQTIIDHCSSRCKTSSILDFCSNGVKIRGNNQKINGGSDTMLIWAIAEHPFVSSAGVPCPAA